MKNPLNSNSDVSGVLLGQLKDILTMVMVIFRFWNCCIILRISRGSEGYTSC